MKFSKKSNEQFQDLNLLSNSATTYGMSEDISRQLDKIASLNCSVLITGETGTGKSTLARLIHQRSKRRESPFVAISCAALPRELLEAELFGYERGAFTGAIKARPGKLETANGGTLFLDEIGDMALELQPKLLMFLEDRVIERIGSNHSKKIDTRIISATLHDLSMMCVDKSFRNDLFFRLKVISLHIPPIREKSDHLPHLVRKLLNKIGVRHQIPDLVIEESAMAKILEYDWPGNVRELENCLERTILISGNSKICIKSIHIDKPVVNRRAIAEIPSLSLGGLPLAHIERQAINQTLELCKGNKREAARYLGISEKSIYNKMLKFRELAQVLSWVALAV